MNDQKELLKSIIINTSFENKNKYEIIYILSGLLSNVILTRLIFNRNKDIKEFTNSFLGQSYKDYIFKSRTLLYSRLVRDAYKIETIELRNYANKILSYIANTLELEVSVNKKATDNSKKKKSHHSQTISGWREVINPEKGNE